MRLQAYAGTSVILAAGALLKAFNQRPNFYSATVYLSQSNACVLILANLALVCAVSFIYGLQRLLYGPLRPIEIEQLSEKAWYAVLDTLLAMPSLRDDVGGWLISIFVLLLAGKVWGWIGEGRVDILEQQPPQDPRLFHARLASSLVLSILFDILMFRYCIKTVQDDPRPGMMVIFTFEFAILSIFSLFTACRYVLALVEIRVTQQQTKARIEERKAEIREERERLQREAGDGETPTLPSEDDVDENEIDVPGWEEKRRWLFGLELATDFIKIIIYTVFFTISLAFIGLPMHIMRDVYLTFAAFTKRLQDYSNYRKATHDMNSRYPDATAEELGNDNTCIVCRETMVPWEAAPQPNAAEPARRRTINEGLRAKKLPCGHILHLRCLKAWLERQQACPTCRRPVIQPLPARGAGGVQAIAPGGVAAALANGPQHPHINGQQRRNRVRWLNMGPVRIGFYNGPGNAENIVRAEQNRQLAQADRLNLRNAASNSAALQVAETQSLLRTAELRLLEQAHNMSVQAAQLNTVRALEAELARLRSLVISPGMQASVQAATAANGNGSQVLPAATLSPGLPGQTMPLPLPPQNFRPTDGQQPLGPGHLNLPEGMTLPEGWSLLPLHRATPHGPVTHMQSPVAPPFAGQMPSGFIPHLGVPHPSENHGSGPDITSNPSHSAQAQTQSTDAPSGSTVSQLGPIAQESASTTQTPTSSATAAHPPPSTSHNASASGTQAPPNDAAGMSSDTGGIAAQTASNPASAPWASSEWAFGGTNDSVPSGPSTTQAAAPDREVEPSVQANGHVESLGDASETHNHAASKGKAKAVEVEDVPDDS